MERCVIPLDAEAQVPEEVPPSGAQPLGGWRDRLGQIIAED